MTPAEQSAAEAILDRITSNTEDAGDMALLAQAYLTLVQAAVEGAINHVAR